jgi:hypothetical protein
VLGTIGDVDGDGIDELFAVNQVPDGDVHVYSCASGQEIATLTGNASELFGASVAAVDDLDGDGVPELLVGSPTRQDSKKSYVGAAEVISPVTGAVLRTHDGTGHWLELGLCVRMPADLDGQAVTSTPRSPPMTSPRTSRTSSSFPGRPGRSSPTSARRPATTSCGRTSSRQAT